MKLISTTAPAKVLEMEPKDLFSQLKDKAGFTKRKINGI